MARQHNLANAYLEHAAKLNSYLQTALQSNDNANGQAIEPRGVRAAFIGILSLIVKLRNVPTFDDVRSAVAHLRTEITAAAETSARLHNETRAAIETAYHGGKIHFLGAH